MGANLVFVFQSKAKFEPIGCGPAAASTRELTGFRCLVIRTADAVLSAASFRVLGRLTG
jgi:hypothetical protein